MSSLSDTALWATRLAQINAIEAALITEGEALKAQHAASPFWRHHQLFIEASANYSSIVLIYFAGFQAVFAGTPGVMVHDEVRNWTRRVNRSRSAYAISTMNASAQCSALEGFLRSTAGDWLDQPVVERVREQYQRQTRSGGPQELSKSLPAARNQLDAWLKPTGGAAFTEWARLVSIVFGCSLPPELTPILEDLIGFRHMITHPSSLPDDVTLQRLDVARPSCWGLAAMVMASTITHSVVCARGGRAAL